MNEKSLDGVSVQLDAPLPCASRSHTRLEGYTLVLAQSGVASVEVDFTVYRLEADMAVSFAPGSTVRLVEADGAFRCSVLAFSREVAVEVIPRPEPAFLDFMRRFPLGHIPSARAASIRHAMADMAHFLYDASGVHRRSIVRNLVQNVLFELYDATCQRCEALAQRPFGRKGELFLEFIHLVYAHADREREVSFFSDRLCITPRYLARILRDCTGETAKEIIDRHCVQEIKARLRTTNEPLQSIARDLHFPDQSFFTRYFKKLTGLTPSEFRAQEL